MRQQIDFKVRGSANDAAFEGSGGVSTEPDYLSRFVGVRGQWDFDQKLTSLDVGLSYTWSVTRARLDHDATPYIYDACGTPTCNFASPGGRIENTGDGGKLLYGDRHDWGATLGVTRILNPQAQVQANLAYVSSRGYLSNPYKVVEVAFIDPELQFLAPNADTLYITVNSLLDKRPDLRNQWIGNLRYAQFIERTEGSLQLGYTYFSDDWGIRAHTLEASYTQPLGAGWTVAPMLRYYTQTAASFYTPYLVTNQGQYTSRVDPGTGNAVTVPFDAEPAAELLLE